MSRKSDRLPLTAMNRLLLQGLKRIRQMTLSESIDHQVRAKLLTETEAEEIRNRFTEEELSSVPNRAKAQ